MAEYVSVIDNAEDMGCEHIATTSSSVKHQVGWYSRSREKVATELSTLAKNAAAKLGGNAISAIDEPSDGSQTFDVYSCPK